VAERPLKIARVSEEGDAAKTPARARKTAAPKKAAAKA
jgi:hypothetical protein